MRNLLVTTTLLFCFLTQGFSQVDTSKISFNAKWQAGKAYTYYLFQNKYNPKNEAYVKNTDTTIVTVKPLKNNGNTALELVFDYSKQQAKAFPLQGVKKAVKQAAEKPIVLLLDKSGKYVAIKNWQELRQRCLASLSNEQSADKETVKYWRTKVQTKEQIEALFMEDFEFFFMLYGSVLVKNAAMDYVDEMLYSNANLAANTHLTVKQDAKNEKVYKIELHTIPNPEKAKTQLNQYRRMAKEQEDNPDVMPEKAMFDLQDFYKYTYNSTNGILEKATYLRYVRNGTKELVNEWFFKLAD